MQDGLRRHVARGPQLLPGRVPVVRRRRDAKVRQDKIAISSKQYILGLQVAVRNLGELQEVQRHHYVGVIKARLSEREPPAASRVVQQRAEVAPGDVLQAEVYALRVAHRLQQPRHPGRPRHVDEADLLRVEVGEVLPEIEHQVVRDALLAVLRERLKLQRERAALLAPLALQRHRERGVERVLLAALNLCEEDVVDALA